MVNDPANSLAIAATWLLAQEKSQSALQRMDPQTRTKVLAALAGFVILGLGLVALAWVGARVTRRYMNQGTTRRLDVAQIQDDWATKPLVPPQKTSGELDDEV